jgi:hypothetical protein
MKKLAVCVLTVLVSASVVFGLTSAGTLKICPELGKPLALKAALNVGPAAVRFGVTTSGLWNVATGPAFKGSMSNPTWTYNIAPLVAVNLRDTAKGPTPTITTISSDNVFCFQGNKLEHEHKLLLDYVPGDTVNRFVPSGYSYLTVRPGASRLWVYGAQVNWGYKKNEPTLYLGPRLERWLDLKGKTRFCLVAGVSVPDLMKGIPKFKLSGEGRFPLFLS